MAEILLQKIIIFKVKLSECKQVNWGENFAFFAFLAAICESSLREIWLICEIRESLFPQNS